MKKIFLTLFSALLATAIFSQAIFAQPKAIDMGLSVKWASCNLGASSPEALGNYYAWGETEPKDAYNWFTYKLCNGSYQSLTKYNNREDYGPVDDKLVLEPMDDAAHVRLGGKWRIPTDAEWEELKDKCTWTKATQNGVKGMLVTSNVNGASLFLPAAGMIFDTKIYNGPGQDDERLSHLGYYWSSTLNKDNSAAARGLFTFASYCRVHIGIRFAGQSIRPVSE